MFLKRVSVQVTNVYVCGQLHGQDINYGLSSRVLVA